MSIFTAATVALVAGSGVGALCMAAFFLGGVAVGLSAVALSLTIAVPLLIELRHSA